MMMRLPRLISYYFVSSHDVQDLMSDVGSEDAVHIGYEEFKAALAVVTKRLSEIKSAVKKVQAPLPPQVSPDDPHLYLIV